MKKTVITVVLALCVISTVCCAYAVAAESAKTDVIKETDASEQKKAQKDKKYVLEDDDSLKVTVTDVDVSGKTFKQVKKEMQEEAKKNGGVMGEKE